MRLTQRDEAMLEWLEVVRFADMDAIRYALGGLLESRSPVSLRRSQQWVARVEDAGLVGRARATFSGGSIVWPTFQWSGRAAPNLFRQTVRHDVAVAAVSSRYLLNGFSWERDRVPATKLEHQVDGVAVRGDRRELVEVELTTKTLARYKAIFTNHVWRLQRENATRVVYFCDPTTARAIRREAEQLVFRGELHRVVALAALDSRGRFTIGDHAFVDAASSSPVELFSRDDDEVLQ